jgi:ATP-dependent DNA helicase PIF1
LPHPPDHYFTEHCIFSAHNDDTDHLNEKILNDFPGEERVYLSADSIKEDTSDPEAVLMYPTEYLNMITASGLLPLHKLTLKVGSPVMVLHNLNPAEGVCNRTRGIITHMTNRVLELHLLGGDHDGHLVYLPRIKCYPSNAQISFQLGHLQFCVRNAFSMSVKDSLSNMLALIFILLFSLMDNFMLLSQGPLL